MVHDMAMTTGQKITPPYIRGTSAKNVIHALDNLNGLPTMGAEKALCNRATLLADQPVKRFQASLENNCSTCEKRVRAGRAELRKSRWRRDVESHGDDRAMTEREEMLIEEEVGLSDYSIEIAPSRIRDSSNPVFSGSGR